MHERVIFPDFSAFQMTIAARPVERRSSDKIPDADAAAGSPPGTCPDPVLKIRTRRTHVTATPFSWLGGDAWPNFPARADKGF